MSTTINVTQEDIDADGNPIETAFEREYGLKCIVDKKYLIVKGNEEHPFRLSLSAEIFNFHITSGLDRKRLGPFSFEIG
jgi:hypothetical protein